MVVAVADPDRSKRNLIATRDADERSQGQAMRYVVRFGGPGCSKERSRCPTHDHGSLLETGFIDWKTVIRSRTPCAIRSRHTASAWDIFKHRDVMAAAAADPE
jgi:hypothetical protein